MARCLQSVLMLLLFVAAFKDGRVRPEEIQLAYVTALKVLLCLVLLTGGNIVKTLVAKLLSSHFHKRAHFDKMQDALNKVSLLPAHSSAWWETCCSTLPLVCLHRVSCVSNSVAQTAVRQVLRGPLAVSNCIEKGGAAPANMMPAVVPTHWTAWCPDEDSVKPAGRQVQHPCCLWRAIVLK